MKHLLAILSILLLLSFPAIAEEPDTLAVVVEEESGDGPMEFSPRLAFLGTMSRDHGPEYDLGAGIRWIRWKAFASEVGATIGTSKGDHAIESAFFSVVGDLGSLEDYGVDVRVIKGLGLALGAFIAVDWNVDGETDESSKSYEIDIGGYASVFRVTW